MGYPKAFRARQRSRGFILISTLFFVVILTVLMMGVSTSVVGHRVRVEADVNYACAMDMAEAGINYELSRLNANPNSVDQYPGNSYTLGAGSFNVWCTNRDGSTPWTPPSDLYVISVGTVNGVSRTVKVSIKGGSGSADYAVFAMKQGNINGTPGVYGSVGTNGSLNINGNPTITGPIVTNGPGSTATINPSWRFTATHLPNAVSWPTVDQIANQQFAGGLTWLATHSDNSLAYPAIVNNAVTMNGNNNLTLHGKAGGANYYLTNLNLNGNSKIVFDNSAGPINIWFGPSGSTGNININGGTASIAMSSDPSKACRIYVAQNTNVNLNGNSELDAGVYAYNGNNNSTVNFNGTGDIYGCVIANNFNFNGNPDINYTDGYFQPQGGYYGYDNSWVEVGGR